MIKLKVLKLLKEKGRTKYWLWSHMDTSYQNFNNMVENRTKSIQYKNIELFCNLLECKPNDLFEIIDDKMV